MMSKNMIEHLTKLWEFMEYHNNMAPFPVYDTDYVKTMKEKINKLKTDSKINYDLLPTVACKHCDNLHLLPDEFGNDICMRCGSINEINIFSDYFKYEEYVKDKLNGDS